jgi:flagellin-like hook-associated protein FlgL
MISGLNSSSFATAIRAAGQSRAMVDRASRQMAAGSEVTSVKDDAARWVRANKLRSDAGARDVLAMGQEYLSRAVGVGRTTIEERIGLYENIHKISLSAAVDGLSAQARAALQADATLNFDAIGTVSVGSHGNTMPVTSVVAGSQWGPGHWSAATKDFAFQVDLDGNTQATNFLVMNSLLGAPVLSTTAGALTAATDARLTADSMRPRIAQFGAVERALATMAQTNRDKADLELVQADAMLGNDMGRISANLSKAQTREQLALATVRTAISAYSAFSTGLLSNVQRTQRAIA